MLSIEDGSFCFFLMTVRGGLLYVLHVGNCAVGLLQPANGLKRGGGGADFF